MPGLAAGMAGPNQPATAMKTKDARKETKKKPTKTPKEKKLAKQQKRESR